MAAFNYMVQAPDAYDSVLKGMDVGFALSDRAQKQAQAEAQARAQQEAQMRAQQIQQAFYTNKNPTLQDVVQFTTTLDPALVGHVKDMLGKMPQEQQKRNLSSGVQMLSALDAGNTDIAMSIAEESAAALENSGDTNGAQLIRKVAEVAKANPDVARSSILASLVQYPGGQEAIDSYFKVRKGPVDISLTGAQSRKTGAEASLIEAQANTEPEMRRAQIAQIYSQNADRAGRLSLDQDKFVADVQAKLDELSGRKLPESAQKQITDAQANAVLSEQSHIQTLDLASRLDQLGGGYGKFGSLAEWYANATGSQDALSQARTDYVRIRNSAAMKALPPGPATDKDIELAMRGFPPETADAKYLASFLRGTAKMQAAEAAFEDVKSQWIDSVGYLGKPRQDIEVGGVKVPAGTTLVQFWNKQGKQFIDQVQSRNALKKYDKYATGGQ